MTKYLISTFLLLLVICFTANLWAQQAVIPTGKGQISGKIIDSISGDPIEFATIALIPAASDKPINGTSTNHSGEFKLSGIPDGTYKLTIYFVGYHPLTKPSLLISNQKNTLSLGSIRLSSRVSQLKEMTVNAQKSVIENKIDKMVYNVENDLTAQGGVATDVLKKVPQLSVDVNGNVELQGNANLLFLINGKPSSMFGSNVADALQSIPASQIEKIEVISSPGARYDAEGTGGIINIILKKSKAQGYNGSVAATLGSRLENTSLNLNARKGRFALNLFFSGNAQINSMSKFHSERNSQDSSGTRSLLVQEGSSKVERLGYQTGLNISVAISPKDNLSASIGYNASSNTNTGITNRQIASFDNAGNQLTDVLSALNVSGESLASSVDYSLNYKRSFQKEGAELDVLITSSDGSNRTTYNQLQQSLTGVNTSGSNGNNPGTDRQSTFVVNYTLPYSKRITIETGTKAVIRTIQNSSAVSLYNTSTSAYDLSEQQSSKLHYQRDVYAYYLSTTFSLNHFDLKVGCRDEYTASNANFSHVGDVQLPAYNSIVPSFVIAHAFSKEQSLKLSYTKRLQRPDYRDVNPFLNASDPKNMTVGNPHLQPEIANNIELTYSKFFKKGVNLMIAAFSRSSQADIQPYTTYYSTYYVGDSMYSNVALTTRMNIGLENNYGMNVFISVPASSKLHFRSNISCFQRYIFNSIDPGKNISGFNYRINVNGAYQITKDLALEIFGSFNSPRVGAQGTMPTFTTYNFAIRKQFFHQKASFAFTTTNPFNQYVPQHTQTTGTNFTLVEDRQYPYRSFGISFTYKFGRLEFKKEKVPDDPNLTNPPVAD